MKLSTPRFIQGIHEFSGKGYETPTALGSYTVAADKRGQPVYLRAGNSSDGMVVLTLTRGGELMRYFPIGAKSAEHVPLAVVEDIFPGTEIGISIAAPAGVSGTVVLDFAMVEV